MNIKDGQNHDTARDITICKYVEEVKFYTCFKYAIQSRLEEHKL